MADGAGIGDTEKVLFDDIAGGVGGTGDVPPPAGGEMGENVLFVGVFGENNGDGEVMEGVALFTSSRQWIPESGLMVLVDPEPLKKGDNNSVLDDRPDLLVLMLGLCVPGVTWKLNDGENDPPKAGETGNGVAGFENGVAHLELLNETNMAAASCSLSSRLRSLFVALTSPSTLPSLSPDSQSSSLPCIVPFLRPGIELRLFIDFPFKDRCREQYPLRCDSLLQLSREHSRLHCFPLNFFRMPLGIWTMSPFLYFCCVGVGVRDTSSA